MSASRQSPFNLVPEIALLQPLPEHWQKRFADALTLMHQDWQQPRSWQEIANASAISPSHFHRQFTELFHETPGQYLARLRLQHAVNLLLSQEQHSVTDVAHACGFSSSQALAKALKRELGISAKTIRQMADHATPHETAELIAKLAHPSPQHSLETELVQAMPTELVWYPARGMKKLTLANPDWDNVIAIFGEKSRRLLSATPIAQLDNPWQQIETFIGDGQAQQNQHDFTLPEGYYLCAEVYLASDVAYSAALDALFAIAARKQLEIDQNAFLLEFVRDVELTPTGGATFSFQLPVLTETLAQSKMESGGAKS